MVKLVWVDYGLASRVEDEIWVNTVIRKYPSFYWRVMAHEHKHTGGWNPDVWLELRDGPVFLFDTVKILVREPSTRSALNPFHQDVNVVLFCEYVLLVLLLAATLYAIVL